MNRKIVIKNILVIVIIALIILGNFTVYAVEKEYVGVNFCSEQSTQRIMQIVGYILILAKILIPIIIIVMGSFDLFKAVIANDDKTLGKQAKNLALRIALGVFIFFIPSLVNWFMGLMYDETHNHPSQECIECVLSPLDSCNP